MNGEKVRALKKISAHSEEGVGEGGRRSRREERERELCRGGRTRSNGKCSKKVAMMDKDLNGNSSNGKCPNWK